MRGLTPMATTTALTVPMSEDCDDASGDTDGDGVCDDLNVCTDATTPRAMSTRSASVQIPIATIRGCGEFPRKHRAL